MPITGRRSDERCYALARPKDDDEQIEVRCPDCGASVRVTVAEAERTNKARCPNGHEVPLAKALG
jgi:hypothetical protein